jgi:hypothetical protein
MIERSWHRVFDDPIPLPDGGELHSLCDAGNYIAKLSTRQHDAPAWQAAIQALMLVAEHGGDTMLPRIGIMRALYPGETAPTPRKKRARKYRIVRQSDQAHRTISTPRMVPDGARRQLEAACTRSDPELRNGPNA